MARRLTYANVMSTIAVFLALTGGLAWALGRNSVKSKHIADGTIQSIDVGADALTGENIDESSLGKVPSAASADSATHAGSADSTAHADAADTAINAQSALNAANAQNAAHAADANHATSADTATNATHATNATNATNAGNASFAGTAAHADDSDTLEGLSSSAFMLADGFESAGGTSGVTSTTHSGHFGTGGTNQDCVIGEMIPFAGNWAPPGTLFAHGQLLDISIPANQLLFFVIGTTYGGDGEDNFALPDARNQGPGNTDWLICVDGVFPSH